MGGSVLGASFYLGSFAAAMVAGLSVGLLQFRLRSRRSLIWRVAYHLLGLVLTASIWSVLLTWGSFSNRSIQWNTIVELLLWLTAFSIPAWFSLGCGAWVWVRDSMGSDK